MKAIVVIGTSAGGLAALKTLVTTLPRTLAAAVCVIQHIGRHKSLLPGLLQRCTELPVQFARDEEFLQNGHIYVAPPDCHVLIVDHHTHLSHGPRENRARPAIDPTMRTAGEQFGSGAIGVILTGMLNDGTAGLHELKRRGGIALIQDPATAEYPDMPQSALDNVAVDRALPIEKLGPMITRLVADLELQGQSAPGEAVAMTDERPIRKPIALTCPDCGGALEPSAIGPVETYQCHIGHRVTGEILADMQLDALEWSLESAIRVLNERRELAERMVAKPLVADSAERVSDWRQVGTQAEAEMQLLIDLGKRMPSQRRPAQP